MLKFIKAELVGIAFLLVSLYVIHMIARAVFPSLSTWIQTALLGKSV